VHLSGDGLIEKTFPLYGADSFLAWIDGASSGRRKPENVDRSNFSRPAANSTNVDFH
jgi:hypothetical protein